jgi:hypothetical protein
VLILLVLILRPAHLQRLFALADGGAGLPPLDSFRHVAHVGAPARSRLSGG